jgi:hypothetical protein
MLLNKRKTSRAVQIQTKKVRESDATRSEYADAGGEVLFINAQADSL